MLNSILTILSILMLVICGWNGFRFLKILFSVNYGSHNERQQTQMKKHVRIALLTMLIWVSLMFIVLMVNGVLKGVSFH